VSERYSRAQVEAIYTQPFLDLLYQAQTVHRAHHPKNAVQLSTLLSIKTGACPEDCGYCSQSAHHSTGLERQKLMDADAVVEDARKAKEGGSTRFCMGAAWRKVQDSDLPALERMVAEVKALGLETCMTLGTVSRPQAERLAHAGLDYYNHNLDTSREHYGNVVTTRGYDERLETLKNVSAAGMKVCCGGIVGLGETREDRIGLLWELANLPSPPDSVPVNSLVPIPGTPMEGNARVDPIEFVRTIATARILMPKSAVRLSAGRQEMTDELQALCFMAGANSIFAGERLLTTGNPAFDADRALFEKLGLVPMDADPEIQASPGLEARGHAVDV
jgi:biotin synthase